MKLNKKLAIIIGSIILAIGVSSAVVAYSPVKLIINGMVVDSDVEPRIEDGRTMVPLRVVSETLGAKVHWDAETRTVTIEGSNVEDLSQPRLVTLHGNPYVEGKYPVHWTYDLNAVKRYVNNAENEEEIRQAYIDMSQSTIQVEDRTNVTADEWEQIQKDIEFKLQTMESLNADESELRRAISLHSKFLEEAKSGDYARYAAMDNAIKALSEELN